MWRLIYQTGAEGFALAIGIATFRRLPIAYKLIVILLGFAAVCEVAGYYVGWYKHHPNAWIFNIYMLVEQLMLAIAAMYMVTRKWQRQVMGALLLADIIIWIACIKTNSLFTFANFSMVSGAVTLTICYLIVLFARDVMISARILNNPDFWLCIAMLVYFSGNVPFMSLHNYLVSSSPKIADELANINLWLCNIRYPATAVSFILTARQHSAELIED